MWLLSSLMILATKWKPPLFDCSIYFLFCCPVILIWTFQKFHCEDHFQTFQVKEFVPFLTNSICCKSTAANKKLQSSEIYSFKKLVNTGNLPSKSIDWKIIVKKLIMSRENGPLKDLVQKSYLRKIIIFKFKDVWLIKNYFIMCTWPLKSKLRISENQRETLECQCLPHM